MPTRDAVAFAAGLKPGTRLLGVDPGTKVLGLALSDVTRAVASPAQSLARRKFTQDAETIAALCAKEGVGGLVVGFPLNMDGSEGPRAQSARDFARALEAKLGLTALLWDERLSTAAAERTLLEADASRKRRGEVIDKMAAAVILQGALDRLAYLARAQT